MYLVGCENCFSWVRLNCCPLQSMNMAIEGKKERGWEREDWWAIKLYCCITILHHVLLCHHTILEKKKKKTKTTRFVNIRLSFVSFNAAKCIWSKVLRCLQCSKWHWYHHHILPESSCNSKTSRTLGITSYKVKKNILMIKQV